MCVCVWSAIGYTLVHHSLARNRRNASFSIGNDEKYVPRETEIYFFFGGGGRSFAKVGYSLKTGHSSEVAYMISRISNQINSNLIANYKNITCNTKAKRLAGRPT